MKINSVLYWILLTMVDLAIYDGDDRLTKIGNTRYLNSVMANNTLMIMRTGRKKEKEKKMRMN